MTEAIRTAMEALTEIERYLGWTAGSGTVNERFLASSVLRKLRPAIATLTAEMERPAPEPVMAWQPIETAPRGSGEDGPGDTRHPDYVQPPQLLLWTQEGPVVGYYDWYYHPGYGNGAEPGESTWRDHDGGRTYGASHWMPLPAAPQKDQT